MKPWYRNSTLQMDDGEMEHIQSLDCASCAVWEWIKGDCQKRSSDTVRNLSEADLQSVSRRLGIDSSRFSQISQSLQNIGWIVGGRLRGWVKWQGARTPEEDAMRKQVEYWKIKAESLATDIALLSGVPPKTSHSLPNTPLDERRGDKRRKKESTALAVVEVIPVSINTPEFNAAWVKWHEHLKQKRKVATVHSRDLQLKNLEKMGVTRAISALHFSIEKGWQGIYEANNSNNGQKISKRLTYAP